MPDAGRRPFKLSLSVVPPQRPAQQRAFPPEGVLLSEPMTRFRCNEKGCCCSGWDIPFKLEDFLRLHEHLDEGDRAALTKQLKLVLEPPKSGQAIDEGEQVLHALKLAGVGDDQHCRFLTERGGCGVQEKYGLSALPDLCVDFPAFGYRQGEGAVELFFDPVCPEVLERLDESDEPLRLLHRREPFGWATHDLRVEHAATPVRVSLDGTVLSPQQLLAVRAACVEAFADRSRPPWRALASLLHAIRELKTSDALPAAWPGEVQDPTQFLQFLHRCISSHSAELLLILFQRYKRFVFALDIGPALARRDEMKAHLTDFWPAFGNWLAPHEDELAPLAARYLAHRFASPFVKQRGELRQAADSIAHLYGTALRYAAALAATLQRPADRALFKVALGASEFFYRSLHLPMESLPWFASAGPLR
jgi:Fe-S-cluster containining protein